MCHHTYIPTYVHRGDNPLLAVLKPLQGSKSRQNPWYNRSNYTLPDSTGKFYRRPDGFFCGYDLQFLLYTVLEHCHYFRIWFVIHKATERTAWCSARTVQQIHQKWYKKFFLYWCQVHFSPWRWMLRRLRCVQSKRFFIKFPYSVSTPSSIDSDFCRLPTASVLSNKADNYVPISFDQQAQVFLEAICQADIREIVYYYL